jgi:hypothetical protein
MANFNVGKDAKTVNVHLKLSLRAGVKNKSLKQSQLYNRLFLYIRICKGVVLVSMYIFYLFDFFLFSALEKREKIWHWDKAGFRFVNCYQVTKKD